MRELSVVVNVKGMELQFSITRRIWKYDLYFSDEFTLCILLRSEREKVTRDWIKDSIVAPRNLIYSQELPFIIKLPIKRFVAEYLQRG